MLIKNSFYNNNNNNKILVVHDFFNCEICCVRCIFAHQIFQK